MNIKDDVDDFWKRGPSPSSFAWCSLDLDSFVLVWSLLFARCFALAVQPMRRTLTRTPFQIPNETTVHHLMPPNIMYLVPGTPSTWYQ